MVSYFYLMNSNDFNLAKGRGNVFLKNQTRGLVRHFPLLSKVSHSNTSNLGEEQLKKFNSYWSPKISLEWQNLLGQK